MLPHRRLDALRRLRERLQVLLVLRGRVGGVGLQAAADAAAEVGADGARDEVAPGGLQRLLEVAADANRLVCDGRVRATSVRGAPRAQGSGFGFGGWRAPSSSSTAIVSGGMCTTGQLAIFCSRAARIAHGSRV